MGTKIYSDVTDTCNFVKKKVGFIMKACHLIFVQRYFRAAWKRWQSEDAFLFKNAIKFIY